MVAHRRHPAARPGWRSSAPSGTGLADLVVRSSRGDERAFADLYQATAARVYGLVVRVLRSPAQSEEVTQEVFLELWRSASRFDPERGSAESWVFTIAHRKAVDRVRATDAARKRDVIDHQRSHLIDFDTTSEEVTASFEAQHVRSAMAALTPLQNEAVRLAYFGGYTTTEIATALGIPAATVRTRIRDGLIRLRGELGSSRR